MALRWPKGLPVVTNIHLIDTVFTAKEWKKTNLEGF
jgi:hypothetical protein